MSEIAELFQRDPLNLTRDDITQVIAHFRASREIFMSAGTRTKQETKEPKAPKGPKITGIDLSTLKL